MVRKLPDVEDPIETFNNTDALSALDVSSDSDSDVSLDSEELAKLRIATEEGYGAVPNLVQAPPNNAPDFRENFKPRRIFTKMPMMHCYLKTLPVAKNYQTFMLTSTIDFRKVGDVILDTPHKQYAYILNKIAYVNSNTMHKLSYIRVHPEFHRNGNIHTHSICQFETNAHAHMYRSNLHRLLGNQVLRQIDRTPEDFNRSLEYIIKESDQMAEVNLYPYYFGQYV